MEKKKNTIGFKEEVCGLELKHIFATQLMGTVGTLCVTTSEKEDKRN